MSSSHAILSCQAARRAAANPSRAGQRLENSLFSYKSIWQDLKDRREIAPFFRSAALSAFEKTAFERNVEPVDVGTHSEEGLRKSTQRKSIFGGKTVEDCGVFPQIRSKESTRQRGPRPQARFRILAHPPRSECAHIGATAPGPSAPCCERSFGCDEKLTVVSLKRMPAQLQIVNQNVGKEAEGRRHHY
jgi:hypothetical protein